MTRHHIGTIDDFPEGRGQKVTVDGIEFAVFNLEGKLYGIQNLCPHKNLPMDMIGKPKRQNEELAAPGNTGIRGQVNPDVPSINCPWHYLEWNLETGHNPVTDKHVATYDIAVEDGDVYVEL